MREVSAVFLMPEELGRRVCELAAQISIAFKVELINDLSALECSFVQRHDLLLSFGTGVIVPKRILDLPGLVSLNVHAASPNYPGRDPHHFAVYDGVRQYGATMHYMTEHVDAGAIVDVELFDVPHGVSPSELMKLANDAGLRILHRFLTNFSAQDAPPPMPGQSWGERKTTRQMFLEMCRIDPSMSMKEIQRRYKATFVPGYRNLYINLHGYRFRIDGQVE